MITDGFACTVTNALQAVTIHNKVLNSVQMSSDDSDGLIAEWISECMNEWTASVMYGLQNAAPITHVDRQASRILCALSTDCITDGTSCWIWTKRLWRIDYERIALAESSALNWFCRRRPPLSILVVVAVVPRRPIYLPASLGLETSVGGRPDRQTDRRPRR